MAAKDFTNYFCGLCGDAIFRRDRHNISIHPDTKTPCHEACLEKLALRDTKPSKPDEPVLLATMQDRCNDLQRALREHNPGAKVAACTCGNIALAFVEDSELGMHYTRCLACGANVTLRFVDDGNAASARREYRRRALRTGGK